MLAARLRFVGRTALGCSAGRRLVSNVRLLASSASDDLHAKTEAELRKDLAIAHRLTALYGYDELVFNHLSVRLPADSEHGENAFLVTPGTVAYESMRPEDLVITGQATNVTGTVIHGAIYSTRPDINAIMHTHSPPVAAVSCLESGLECLTLDSAMFYERVGYHAFEGLNTDCDEQERIARDFPAPNHTLMMTNHAALTAGRSIGAAWVRWFYLVRVCEALLMTYSTGKPVVRPSRESLRQAASHLVEDGEEEFMYPPGVYEWPELKKIVERKLPF